MTLQFFFKHKALAAAAVIVIAGGGYRVVRGMTAEDGGAKYVLAPAEKGMLVSAVSGSGEVLVSRQSGIKAKVSGEIVALPAAEGQAVKAGTVLAVIDAGDARKSVRDAQANLEAARLSLEKLLKPADELSLLQRENALAKAVEAKKRAEDDIRKAYEGAFNDIADAFLDMPAVIDGVHDILYGTDAGATGQWNLDYYYDAARAYDSAALRYRDDAAASYRAARDVYDDAFGSYKAASRFSSDEVIVALARQTYDAAKIMAEAVKNAADFIQFYADTLTSRNLQPKAAADRQIADLGTFTGTMSGQLAKLLAVSRSLQTAEESLVNSGRDLAERERSLADLRQGPDSMDLRSQELSVRQRENALRDAQERLADYYVRAPFDGLVAVMDLKKGDTVSSGTAIATLITDTKIASVTLNEVDVARVKVGQKATLEFDAVPGLQLTGQVAEVDLIGVASQGVVSYAVGIAFDAQDERVRPAMTVSANIIIDAKSEVLLVPNAAVKSQGDARYVQVPDEEIAVMDAAASPGVALARPPRRQAVEIGAANDEMTEVVSGLNEGDLVVVAAIEVSQAAARTSAASNGNGVRIPGLPSGGSATFRAGGSR